MYIEIRIFKPNERSGIMNEKNNKHPKNGETGHSSFYKNPRSFTRTNKSSSQNNKNNKNIKNNTPPTSPKAEMAKSSKRDSKKKLSETISAVAMGIIGVVIIALIIMGAKKLYENSTAPEDIVSSSILTESGLTEVLRATPEPVVELEWATEQSIEGLAIATYDDLVVVGSSAYPYFKFNTDVASNYISAVNSIYTTVSSNADFYSIIYPSAIDIMLPVSFLDNYADYTSDQDKTIQYINSQLNSGINTVSVYDVFKSHCDLDLYFDTDSRTTSLSAYYMYETWANEKGIDPVVLDELENLTFTGFLGDIYYDTEISAISTTEAIIIYKSPANLSVTYLSDGTMEQGVVYVDVTGYSKRYMYSTFLFGSDKYAELVNNDITDGSACLIIADDNGNAFAPYVANHYQYTYLINYDNYSGDIVDIMSTKNITDVICLTSITATNTQSSVNDMENIN